MGSYKEDPFVKYVDIDHEMQINMPVIQEDIDDNVRRRLKENIPWGIQAVLQDVNFFNNQNVNGPKKVCVADTGYDLGHIDLPTEPDVTGKDATGEINEEWDTDTGTDSPTNSEGEDDSYNYDDQYYNDNNQDYQDDNYQDDDQRDDNYNGDVEIEVIIGTDKYPSDTSWDLFDSSMQKIMQGKKYKKSFKEYTAKTTAARGCYTFVINDADGDGLCCAWGYGYYDLISDGDYAVYDGGKFKKSSKTEIFGDC